MAEAKKPHRAKPSRKTRKYGRNRAKCEAYRRRVGSPRGPGVAGNKRGKGRGRASGPSASSERDSSTAYASDVNPASDKERP